MTVLAALNSHLPLIEVYVIVGYNKNNDAIVRRK